jgi:L-alanine-DL-glutamate epimerase-like enolase superfamily enzyme
MTATTMTTIASVDTLDITTRYPRSIGRNAVLGVHGTGPTTRAVVLGTTEGAVGWGIAGEGLANTQSLVGRRLDEVFDPAIGVIDPAVMWADFALHDLWGVLTGQPVSEILGGRGSDEVSVYDASIYFDDLDPEGAPRGVDVVLANVQAGWDDGHRAFKLKIGRGFTWMHEEAGFERDVEVVHAVHEAFPAACLLVDGNNGFSVDATIRFLERVQDVSLFWFEEPFNEHRHGLERVREWLRDAGSSTLIADGEYRPDVAEVVGFAREGLVDVLLMDVVSFGLTPWRALARELDGSRVKLSPHAWGLPLKTSYAGQMAGGLSDVVTVEGVRGETVGVDTSGYRVEGGFLTVPTTPGFGIPVPGL